MLNQKDLIKALKRMKHGFSLPQETNPEVLQRVRKKGEA